MRHFKHIGLSAATGLAALLVCTHPASAAGSADLNHDGPQVFQLHTQPTHAVQSTLGTSNDGTRVDELVAVGNLFHDSSQVGTFGETCAITTPPNSASDFQCTITFSLPQGQITVQGRFAITGNVPGDITLAITGGTGHYRTAQGYVHADLVNNTGPEADVTFHLIR